jgi:hypothetical protein
MPLLASINPAGCRVVGDRTLSVLSAYPKRTGAMDGPVRVSLELCLEPRPDDVKRHGPDTHIVRHAMTSNGRPAPRRPIPQSGPYGPCQRME